MFFVTPGLRKSELKSFLMKILFVHFVLLQKKAGRCCWELGDLCFPNALPSGTRLSFSAWGGLHVGGVSRISCKTWGVCDALGLTVLLEIYMTEFSISMYTPED